MAGIMAAAANKNPGKPNDTGPLKDLAMGLSALPTLNFPANIDVVDHYVQFGAYAEQHFPASGKPRPDETLLQSVRLPMPNQLPVAYAQTYKETDLGPLGAAIAAGAQEAGLVDAFESGDTDKIMSAAANTYKESLKELGVSGAGAMLLQGATEGGAIAGAAGGGVAGAAVGGGLQKGLEAVAASAGKAVNPHMAVIYERPQFRKFQFQYNLRPKNRQESDLLRDIIHFFKYYSAPHIEKESHFINYPNQFKIHFHYHEYLFKMGDCVLSNVSVDYHGEGTPLYYDAKAGGGARNLKAPANITLNLDFTETVIVTKDDIMKDR